MALAEVDLSTPFHTVLVLLCLQTVAGMSGWSQCSESRDVIAKIKENSLSGCIVADFVANNGLEGVRWSLSGRDAHWFYLDGRNIRLNTSTEKILDRESLGPVLMAELLCYEEEMFQTVYRIVVEILNENDNLPMFSEKSVQSLTLSELTPVNTVAFTVQAMDADNDKIIYSIDQMSPDAGYFRIDLPNSGEVILSKPLDYEAKTKLSVTICASEMNTAEHYSISTNVTITVQDGDDQYPQFVPCVLLFQDEASQICTSPVYMVNVTEGEEDLVLDFFPGPIHAVDGDRGLSSSISYAILSDEDRHFSINTETGELRLITAVKDRLLTPVVRLKVMAYQDDDPRKYSVSTALVHVLAVNRFYPQFELSEYYGFVTAGKSAASVVNTYGSRALILRVQDKDFDNGFNPLIYFTFGATSNHTDIYQVTHGGLLIAKASHLKPKQKHVLEITAVDQESGDAAYTTVVVEVLPEGQLVPYSPLVNERLTSCTVGKALFLSMVVMGAVGCLLSVSMWVKTKHKGMKGPLERGFVAQGKHPNVSLRCFQLVNHCTAMPHMEEVSFQNEECGACNLSFSFPDKPGPDAANDVPISTKPPSPKPASVTEVTTSLDTETVQSSVVLNNNASTPTKISCSSPDCDLPKLDVSPAHAVEADRLPEEKAGPRCNVKEEQSNIGLNLTTKDDTEPSPSNEQDPLTGASNQFAESALCPSYPSSNEMTPAKMDNPLPIPNEETIPHSPSLSPLLRKTGTPPPTPEHGPLKATLVHIDKSPTDSPPDSPKGTGQTLNAEADKPSTSLDQVDPSETEGGMEDIESLPPDRRTSTNSGNTLNSRGEEDEAGFLGDDDVDKSSEDAESDRTEFRRWSS